MGSAFSGVACGGGCAGVKFEYNWGLEPIVGGRKFGGGWFMGGSPGPDISGCKRVKNVKPHAISDNCKTIFSLTGGMKGGGNDMLLQE